MNTKVIGKDLTKESPRSPRIRVGGYAILGRTLDKCRALVAGNIGEYHFDCPLDNTLFGFKGVKGDDFKAQIEQGASDQEIVEWLNQTGENYNIRVAGNRRQGFSRAESGVSCWSLKCPLSQRTNRLRKLGVQMR